MAKIDELLKKKCLPCEGGVEPCSLQETNTQLTELPSWNVDQSGTSISRKLRFKNFVQALECLIKIGELAEQEQHHPDLHLTGYRDLKVVLTTHAIGGLSENDFIVAAKIDQLDEVDKSSGSNSE